MKHFYPLLITIVIFFISCRNELLMSPETDSEIDSEISTKSVGDGALDVLGYGYDCLYSDFKDPLYVKGQVIDLNKAETGQGINQMTGEQVTFAPTSIEVAQLHGDVDMHEIFGANSQEFAQKLTADSEFGIKFSALFSLNIKAAFGSDVSEKEENAFYRVEVTKHTRKLRLPYTMPSRLKYYVKDNFLQDIKLLSCKDLIQTYGTHVLTDVLLGGSFQAYYTASYNSEDENLNFNFKSEANVLFGSVKANLDYSTHSFQDFQGVEIAFFARGGSKSVVSKVKQSSDGTLPQVDIDYQDWLNSVDSSHEYLLGIGDKSTVIYPLSEFIEDPLKKRELEFAIAAYLQSREINFLGAFYIVSNNYQEFNPAQIVSSTSASCFLSYIIEWNSDPFDTHIYFEREGDFFRLRSSDDDYYLTTQANSFSTNYDYTPSDSRQLLWSIEAIADTSLLGYEGFKFRLKNVYSGLYLSSYDFTMVNKETVPDEQLIWYALETRSYGSWW